MQFIQILCFTIDILVRLLISYYCIFYKRRKELKKFSSVYESTIIVEPRDKKIFHDEVKLTKYVLEAVKHGNMTIKSLTIDFLHGKNHTGLSIIAVVEESHIALYTYPEFNRIHINVATCSNEESIQEIIKYFKKVFKVRNENEIKIINITN